MKLNIKTIEKLVRDRTAGAHGDDESRGLYLRISETGAASWSFRYQLDGKRRAMGLGPWPAVGLAEARAKATELRELVRTGTDPLEQPKAPTPTESALTFEAVARDYIEANRSAWRNSKHAAQWLSTLHTYAFPTIGDKPPKHIATADVLAILNKDSFWTSKPETASRVRGRIEAVLDAARVRGLCAGENPARWRGHLDSVLPARTKASRGHHPALPYAEAPAFMRLLALQPGEGARALELAILTAARSGEVRGMTWAEVDLDAGLWTVPAERMKTFKEHRVPLSSEAVRILRKQKQCKPSDFVFPGARHGRPLSDMSLTAVLRRMNRGDLTAHGFRSTFRDWASEETHHPHAVAEMALAHSIGNAVEAAYRRGDLLEKRRTLMEDWATYLFPPEQ